MSDDLPDLVSVRVEVPRWGFIRRTESGAIDYISPVPCPFNYGAIDAIIGGDGMALDALFFGPRQPVGAVVITTPKAVVHFIDSGHDDHKIVCSTQPLTRAERWQVRLFFTVYAVIKRILNQLRGIDGLTTVRSITDI